MQEKILDSLRRKHDYVSGDMLSHRLGISRQALWKHIQALKDSGYEIVAVPHLGYQLLSVPDRLFPSEISCHLNTKAIAKKIHYFDSLSSTMDYAWQLGMKGEPEGSLVIAESQTKGRGRLGRSWLSPKYKGLYFSLLLRPEILPSQAPLLTLLAAVSVCEAVFEKAGLEAQIKWPNDILFERKKIGGILTELNAEMDAVRFVVIGAGINVNSDKKGLVPHASSLKEKKKEHLNRVELLQEILRVFEKNYFRFVKEGSDFITDKWRHYSFTLGKRVRIACRKKHFEGEAVDIDSDGGLLVRRDSGIIDKIMAGDVEHCANP
ncbi:MAG: biotin--[acetyl-CoA-carboxylase] ligase [Candidatus Omnitrophica bacterium]|nr:biotin--[acetyl-CoA-carboxylase] ligase [Candidatus Omnitrophota bacterium]